MGSGGRSRIGQSLDRGLVSVVAFAFVAAMGSPLAAYGQAKPSPSGSETSNTTESPGRQTIPPPSAASIEARRVLDRVRPSIIQIKGFFGNNKSEAFHGTGFAVAPGGVFVTNWHVVSNALLFPEKYRLEYKTPSGSSGRVVVRAIDVRHDLAIVEAIGFAPAPLELWPETTKGEHAYSVGYPLDVGLTITEGVSNGQVQDTFQPRIHYSGALNSGMSGGPGLDTSGRVIGINVSGRLDSQLVAFFVPAAYAISLLAKTGTTPLDSNTVHKQIAQQLRAYSDALLASLDTPLTVQDDQGYELPGKLAEFFVCRARGDPTPDQPVQSASVYCDAKSSLFVASDVTSGGLWFRHQILTTTLDPWRFARRLQELSAIPAGKASSGRDRTLAPFACKQSDVALDGLQANVIVCLRAYRKFEGLYDLSVHLVSKNSSSRAFISTLNLKGTSAEAALAFAKSYLSAIRWKP